LKKALNISNILYDNLKKNQNYQEESNQIKDLNINLIKLDERINIYSESLDKGLILITSLLIITNLFICVRLYSNIKNKKIKEQFESRLFDLNEKFSKIKQSKLTEIEKEMLYNDLIVKIELLRSEIENEIKNIKSRRNILGMAGMAAVTFGFLGGLSTPITFPLCFAGGISCIFGTYLHINLSDYQELLAELKKLSLTFYLCQVKTEKLIKTF
jgi:hypothetical protein